jgi:hypothetical protein
LGGLDNGLEMVVAAERGDLDARSGQRLFDAAPNLVDTDGVIHTVSSNARV